MSRIQYAGAIVLSALPFLAGCQSIRRDAGFSDVKNNVLTRLGKDVQWNHETTEDAEVAQKVSGLLEKPLTADSSVQIALLNNRNLQATYESLGIAQADLVQAGLLKNPSFKGEILPAIGVNTVPIVTLDLAKDFLDLLFIPLRKRVAAAQFEAAKARVTLKVFEIAGQTQSTFYDLQAAEQIVAYWKTTVEATQASLTATEKMHQAGNISKLDLALERAQHDQAKLSFAQAEASGVALRERMNRLLGITGPAVNMWKPVSGLASIPIDEITLDDFENRAIAQSLQIAASRQDIEAVARRRGISKIQSILPTLEAGIAVDREDDGTWHVGPSLALEIPIFDQGQARRASARAEVKRALETHAALAVEIRSQARSAAATLTQARTRAIFLRDQVLPLRQDIISQTQLQYNAMQVGIFQMLEAKKNQTEAGRQFIETLRDYWKARAQVEQIISGAGESDAGTPFARNSESRP